MSRLDSLAVVGERHGGIARTIIERTILMPREYLAGYENYMRAADLSPRTIAQRLRMAGRILKLWPDPGVATPTDLVDWLGRAVSDSGKPLTRWTRATYHGDVRAFFRWLADAELVVPNPMESRLLKRPKTRRGVPKPLTAAEESRALAAAHGRVRAYLLLALRAGLRASEIAAFRGEEIAEDFIVLVGKGDKEGAVPTHPELWALAQEYPRRGWWFPSPAHGGHIAGNTVTIVVGRHFRSPDVDIPKGSIHRARHSFGTDLLRRGGDLREVQTLMRHSSPATTAIYTAVDEDRLRATINRLGRSA